MAAEQTSLSLAVDPFAGYQSRYVAYCCAHGRTPERMQRIDARRYPGGGMTGYIIWISRQWRAWDAETCHNGGHSADDHAAFDAWLGAEGQGDRP